MYGMYRGALYRIIFKRSLKDREKKKKKKETGKSKGTGRLAQQISQNVAFH